MVSQAALAIGLRRPRIELENLVKILKRAVELFFRQMGIAPIEISIDGFGIEFQRFVIIPDRIVMLTQLEIGETAVVVRLVGFWRGFDRAIVRRYGFLIFSRLILFHAFVEGILRFARKSGRRQKQKNR